RSTFLDLNFVRVARSTVASNSDKITARDSNACIGNVLDVLLDSRKFIAIDDDRPTIDDSLKILHNRCRNINLKSLVLLVRVRINTVLVRNESARLVRLNNLLDSSPLQVAVLDRNRVVKGSTFLDVSYVRVARRTVASNSDTNTDLDSNAIIANILDVLLDSSVGLTLNDNRTAVHDGLEALNDGGRNAHNKLLLILVDICIGAARIVNNHGNSLVGLNDTLDSSPLQLAVLICDQHRIRSTFLDLNFVRVARSTVASNSDKITALDS